MDHLGHRTDFPPGLTKGPIGKNYQFDTMQNEGSRNVTPIRITARTLQSRVHQAAKDSARVFFVPQVDVETMGGRLTRLQALKCLQEGTITGPITQDQHGNWVFTMLRRAAGLEVTIHAAAEIAELAVTPIYVFVEPG